jgi:GNAT superfamily N-acetyltransferase
MAPSQGLSLSAASPSSIKDLEPLFRAYFADVEYPGALDMNALEGIWAPLISRGCATLAVETWGRGIYGVTYMQDTFNGEMTATLVFLWVVPESRGKGIGKFLIDCAERDARFHGCTNLVHGHMFTVEKDGGRSMFEKRGYEVVELGFRKRL